MSKDPVAWEAQFSMREGETLAELLDRYEEIARRTGVLVESVDLDDIIRESLDGSKTMG